ncbi:hypothetical protein [Lactobacillus taiwanensis]|uniref:hypothetical protein n=1 Tax=Lactobacillus taiwanensis TaxID=508451 RepID=UPI0025A638C5|nr:hypothetical protein [Lactobacillus taiwanensis]
MSIFGNAKKAKLKEEALDTKNWISDAEIYSAFFDDKDDSNIIDELNSLIMASSQDHNLISVNTNSTFNETKIIEQKVA